MDGPVIPDEHLWVVILAAGEGKRVESMTCDRRGLAAPKQYSLIGGRATLLETTLARAKKIAPLERIVVIVARQHRRWWETELADLPDRNVIVQPENRGTAAGILLPLLWVTREDPDARLVILPSDHGVSLESTLRAAIADAVACVPFPDSEMVLLGVRPERPENGYGWIVPRPWFGHRLRPIACIREKPEPAVVDTLFEQGALLNSFILIAGGRFLLDLFETTLPDLWRSLDSACGDGPSGFWAEQDLVHRYRSVPTLDFSKEILEQAASLLWVYPVPACGWLDLGTPERLTGFLSACGHEFEDGPLQSVNRGILQASQTQQGLSP